MKPFLLLLLPFLAAKEVVRSYEDYQTVILLGLVSKRTKQLMKNCKYHVEEIEWIIKEDSVDLIIRSKSSSFTIDFIENEGTFYWKLEGNSVNVSSEGTGWTVAVNFPEQNKTLIDAAEFLTHQLLHICNPKLKIISNLDFEDHSENSFVWKLLPKFDVVNVGNIFERDPLMISAQRLKFYFEEAKIDKLYLKVEVEESPTFKYSYAGPAQQKPNFEHLCMITSDWVDFSNFFNSFNSPSIRCTTSSSKRVNRALKEWIGRNLGDPVESGFDHEFVHFETKRETQSYQLEKLLKDTNASAFNLTEKHREQFTRGYNANSFEIIRECDGRKAILMFFGDSLKMVIWTPAMIKKT